MTTSFAPLTVAISDLTAHPANVRRNSPETYDPENIAHRKASIAVLGLLQLFLVQRLNDINPFRDTDWMAQRRMAFRDLTGQL